MPFPAFHRLAPIRSEERSPERAERLACYPSTPLVVICVSSPVCGIGQYSIRNERLPAKRCKEMTFRVDETGLTISLVPIGRHSIRHDRLPADTAAESEVMRSEVMRSEVMRVIYVECSQHVIGLHVRWLRTALRSGHQRAVLDSGRRRGRSDKQREHRTSIHVGGGGHWIAGQVEQCWGHVDVQHSSGYDCGQRPATVGVAGNVRQPDEHWDANVLLSRPVGLVRWR